MKLNEFFVAVNVDTEQKRAEEWVLRHSTVRGQEDAEEPSGEMKVSSWWGSGGDRSNSYVIFKSFILHWKITLMKTTE